MNMSKCLMLCLSLVLVNNVAAEDDWEKMDPRTRDEDISHTKVSVRYEMLPNGLYEYYYDIDASSENIGTITTFSLDIACGHEFGLVQYGEDPLKMFIVHEDAKAIPVQAYGVWKQVNFIGVSVNASLFWGLKIWPGVAVKGLRVISPAKPGLIRYELEPQMEADDWDYITYPVTDPDVPDITDFIVSGVVMGPSCPETTTSLYPGTNERNREPSEVSGLLSYEAPLVDRFHVPSGTKSIEMKIHYSKDIDPKTFKVEPGYIRDLFDPVPGTSQTVLLPLKKNDKNTKKSKFKLEVQMRDDVKGEENGKSEHTIERAKSDQGKDKTKPKERAGLHRDMDIDVFEIRIDEKEREHSRKRGEKGDHK